VWERRSHVFQPHFTPDLGLSRTLAPNIAQMPHTQNALLVLAIYSANL